MNSVAIYNSEKVNVIVKIIILVILLMCYFEQYDSPIPGITLGELLLIFVGIIILCYRNFIVKIESAKYYLLFFVVAFILTCFVMPFENITFTLDSEMTIVSRWIRYFSYVIVTIIIVDNFDLFDVDFLFKSYKILCMIASVYAILQLFLFYTFDYYLPINIMPFEYSRGITSEDILKLSTTNYFRAYGFFVEPSYLIKFILPAIPFSLTGWNSGKKNADYKSLLLVSVAILISTSVQGIVILCISFVAWFLLNNKIQANTIAKIFILVLFGFFLILFLYNYGLLDYPIKRIVGLFSSSSDGSSSVRLYRGFAFWNELPFLNKILGIGMGNSGNFAYDNNIITKYDYYRVDSISLNYMNGISRVLVENGLISFFVFSLVIIDYWRKSNKVGKIIVVQLFLLLLSGSGVFSLNWVFYSYFIMITWNIKKEGDYC